MDSDPFKEYFTEQSPDRREKSYAWATAVGLQAVDGLKPSDYLINTAARNIEGEITLEKANELIHTYYRANPSADKNDRTEEADKVSVRIAALLAEKAFSFTPNEYLSIHRKLFSDILLRAGKMRVYNISKKEWILDGKSVMYGNATELEATLEYDFTQERKFSYSNLSMDEIISHLAQFVSSLWQIHVFEEGNTRTTAVFFIKYLRTLGFDVTNDIFAQNAWYFRNALVRANYNDLANGITRTTEYLELFLRNLLLGETNPLKNRTMHVSGLFKVEDKKADIAPQKADIAPQKADIAPQKADIAPKKADIDSKKPDIGGEVHYYEEEVLYDSDYSSEREKQFTSTTKRQVDLLKENLDGVFGRSDVMFLLDIKTSRASALLKEMAASGLIETVSGQGKGRYRFR